MKSNFDFLASEWKLLFERAKQAETFTHPDLRASYVFARMALELTVNLIYEKDYDLDKKYRDTLHDLIQNNEFQEKLGKNLVENINEIKKRGNDAVHNHKIEDTQSYTVIKHLFNFTKWFSDNYSDNEQDLSHNFDESLLSTFKKKSLTNNELQKLEKKLRSENEEELAEYRKTINVLELEISEYLKKIEEQEEELIGLKKLMSESDLILSEYSDLQSKNKKDERYYSFRIQEIGITEQEGLIWGRVFVNFVFDNKQYFAVKYFAPGNNGRVEERKLVAHGKYQDSSMFSLFQIHHSNLNFREILKTNFDHLQLVKKHDKNRFGKPSILLEKLLLDLKKQFAFSIGDSEYIENGYYKIENRDYMSIWAFKNNFETSSENTTKQNFQDAKKIAVQNIPFYKSKPDYGYFNEVKIYPLDKLKLFYNYTKRDKK